MLCKLAEKDKSKEEKDDDIGDDIKDVEINNNGEVVEVVETENDELTINAVNNALPPQDAPTTTTTTAAADEERRWAHGGNTSVLGMRNGTNGDRRLIHNGEGHRLSQEAYQRYVLIL